MVFVNNFGRSPETIGGFWFVSFGLSTKTIVFMMFLLGFVRGFGQPSENPLILKHSCLIL